MENTNNQNSVKKNQLLLFCNKTDFYKANSVYTGPKIKNNKNIKYESQFVHNIFKEATQYCESKYWKDIFYSLAMDNLSPYIKYEMFNLIYTKGKKKKSIIIDENNLLMVYRDVKNFLTENLKLFDLNDYGDENEREICKKASRWIDIKKDSLTKISKFVDTFNLSPKNREQMIRDIECCIQAKYFHNDNIFVENDEIIKIQGLKVVKGICVIDYDQITPKKLKSKKTSNSVSSTIIKTDGPESIDPLESISKSNYFDKWNKYLENCNKKYNKN